MTQAVVEREAKATDLSIHDIRKRRIWLGPSGERLNATCELEQSAQLNQAHSKARSRRRRVQREHQLLYVMRRFALEHETPDVPFWRPQHVTLQQDSRFPLQGCVLADDTESWLRWSRLRDAPPQLTVAQLPPLLPVTTTPTPMTPAQEAAPEAMSSHPRQHPGALPKSQAGPLFIMRMSSKARPPVNPIAVENATDDGSTISSRSPASQGMYPGGRSRTPARAGARSRSRTPRRTRSPPQMMQCAAITWAAPQDGARSRSRSPRRPPSPTWNADYEWTERRRSPSLSVTESFLSQENGVVGRPKGGQQMHVHVFEHQEKQHIRQP